MKQALATIFRCDDQSALIHNFVASEDPPPGAWSHHSAPLSPLGKVSLPDVLTGIVTLARGEVYTRGREGELIEHMLTRHQWLPWSYVGAGKRIGVERTVTHDLWLAGVRVRNPRDAMLLLELQAGPGLKIGCAHIQRGLRFQWENRFVVDLTFAPLHQTVALSDDPAPLKRQFAGFADVKLNEAHCRSWVWENKRSLWIAVPFRRRIEVRFSVQRAKAGKSRAILFAAARRAEQRRWESFFAEQVPPLRTDDPVLRDTYYFAWQTLWANRCDGAGKLLPRPFTSPARLSYGSQWWWDEAFHAIVYRHLRDPWIAYEGFENFWRAQQSNGAIPGCLRFSAAALQMSMQPPVIGLTMRLLKEKPGWPENLRRIYDALLRLARWHLSPQRDTDRDGLAEYHHSFDTSADQTQRWDSQKLDPKKVIDRLKPTESVDYNVWMSLLWQVLGEMAERLGDKRAATDHARRAVRTMELIERHMWDERDGFYYDIDGRSHQKIRVKTPYGFMPLLSPHVRRNRAERIVREHIFNPKEFWCRYPLPSVSLDNPTFDPINMWRGPTWVNVNWMVVEGLSRQGFHAEAKRLARKTVELVGPRYRGRTRIRSPRLWEWYHPLTGEALGNNQYSWSALVVDLILRFFDEGHAS